MRSATKILTSFAFAALILIGLGAPLVSGKPDYSKKEGKACNICHVKNGSKELNDVGKCYAKDHSLKDCKVTDKK